MIFYFFFLSYLKQKCLFSTYCIRDDYCQRTTKSAKDSDILIDWYSMKRNRYEKHFRRGLHHYSFIKQKYQRSAGNTQEKAMCYSHCAPEIWILTRKSYRWKRWPFFPFQVSPVPHQQEITDSSRGRSFTVFLGGHIAETGVWKTMESFYEREQRRTRNCVNLIYVTVGPANGTVRDMRTFFKVVASEDIYWWTMKRCFAKFITKK